MLHVRAGTDLTPYLLLSPVRRARRLVVLCEQPPRLPVEWAGAPLPETLIVDCADRRALAEVLGACRRSSRSLVSSRHGRNGPLVGWKSRHPPPGLPPLGAKCTRWRTSMGCWRDSRWRSS